MRVASKLGWRGAALLSAAGAVFLTAGCRPPEQPVCQDVTLQADAQCQGSVDVNAVIASYGGDPGQCTVNPNPPFSLGETTATVTCRGAFGIQESCTAKVIVVDSTKPTITCPGDVVTTTDTDACGATNVALGAPTTGDNCGVAGVASDAPGTFGPGNTTVTWTVRDAAGNTASCTQTVTVRDAQAPSITCPEAVAVNTGANALSCGTVVGDEAIGAAATLDNCGSVDVVRDGVPMGNAFPVGTTTVTYTATDSAGNQTSCTQTVTVTDDTAPTIQCPADQMVYPDAHRCAATVVTGTASASDNCSVAGVVGNGPDDGVFGLGTTDVMWTATDSNGNTASCVQHITVTNRAPSAICKAATVSANGSCQGYASVDNGSSDPDDGLVGCTQTEGPYGLGSNSVRLSCTDVCGATTTCDTTVAVVDTTPPTIQCPADMTLECVDNGGVANFTTTQSDNCGPPAVACSPASGSKFTNDQSTVDTCTATDGSGNTASCSFEVLVHDTQAAVATDKKKQLPFDDNHLAKLNLSDCAQVSDDCHGAVDLDKVGKITHITADEWPWWEEILSCSDMYITGNSKFRVEQAAFPWENGRVYTVYYTYPNPDTGEETKGTCTVGVPKKAGQTAVDSGAKWCMGKGCKGTGIPGPGPICWIP